MARTKGSKNRATMIMEEMIAKGIDPAKAKVKAKMQAMREKKSALKSTPKKKRTSKKKTSKKEKVKLHPIVEGYNPTTRNAWKKAKAGNSRKCAIRAMCLMCVGGSGTEVKECTAGYCPLYKFRITG